MVDYEVARSLLEELEKRVRRLQTLGAVSRNDYLHDTAIQEQVERNLEVAIQCCIDLGSHILSDEGRATPETYADVFTELAKHKIIAEELGETFAAAAGFRNVLVHLYLEVDHELVYEALQQVGSFQRFAGAVAGYLQTDP